MSDQIETQAIKLQAIEGKKEQVKAFIDMARKIFDKNGKVTIKVDRALNNKAYFPLLTFLGIDINLEMDDPSEISFDFDGDTCVIGLHGDTSVTLGKGVVDQPLNAVRINLNQIYFDIPRFFDIVAEFT